MILESILLKWLKKKYLDGGDPALTIGTLGRSTALAIKKLNSWMETIRQQTIII